MAFFIAGLLSRISRPSFCALGARLPDVNDQVRQYAARKGTREKRLRIKRAQKLKKAAQAIQHSKNFVKGKKVIEKEASNFSDLEEIPTDTNVYFTKYYKPKEYSLLEALKCHKENLHETVLNVPNTPVHFLFEMNMYAEKITRFVDPWKSNICLPHILNLGLRKSVLVLCDEDTVDLALSNGADKAGGTELIKAIKFGDFNIRQFDVIIGDVKKATELSNIRSKLKPFVLRSSDGTLTGDVIASVRRYKYGTDYYCHRNSFKKNFGWIEVTLGTMDMEFTKIEENVAAFFQEIYLKRPRREGDFVNLLWCSSPPSQETFRINITPYLEMLPAIDLNPLCGKTKDNPDTEKKTEEGHPS